VPWQIGTVYPVGYGYGDIQPEVGVTGTPVIDPVSHTIYLVSKSEDTATNTFYQRLARSGSSYGEREIQRTGAHNGVRAGNRRRILNGVLDFDPQNENQKIWLALAGGIVYLVVGSA